MSNELVAYSRAGDIFHYRWAARRCFHLIYPNSTLRSLVVEGSNEKDKEGEYVIDVTEYHEIGEGKRIDYYQLKHSTVQVDDPFTLSDLKGTFKGFSQRSQQHSSARNAASEVPTIRYIIVTNRAISADLIKNLKKIAEGKSVNRVFKETVEKYTALTGASLQNFCSNVEFNEVKENYLGQKEQLKFEIAQIIAGTVDSPQIDSLVSLVQDKVLPNADHVIVKEQVLQKFGITFERELFPAPPIWEKDILTIPREQYGELRKKILEQPGPFIVHAGGGIGKSVFSRYLVSQQEEGSLAIAFDCFGAGSYRNRSSFRHGHKNALVQIANELASRGLCSPLLPLGTDSDESIMRAFLHRIEVSLDALKKTTPTAKLLIVVDAADNAEMAAIEFNQNCFAHEILRERYPMDFRLVLLCRTERIHFLQPLSNVTKLQLLPFSEKESYENLQKHFPEVTPMDGKEFHRLTSGNPRVQANALDRQSETVAEILAILGPSAVTIEDLIKQQLQRAVNEIKDALPIQFGNYVSAISTGLASLPPHIPLSVLAAVAEVDVNHIRSFVADIGRSLWLSDNSVQFRDEPTETWFRETFSNSTAGYKNYIQKLESLAETSTYVAEALPLLYHQAEEYDKLIEIALSDAYLPKNNPIEERNVRVYRLKFAFQAALKKADFKDAIKLAMRAGEEVAGDKRQLQLLRENIDLLATLQSADKVQQMAYRRVFCGNWPGAENIYSASALSFINDFRGEARSYIRSAQNWLNIYFKDVKERQKSHLSKHEKVENNVNNEDVLELAFAILNVSGVGPCFDFLLSLRPRQIVARVVGRIADRLIDYGRFDEVDKCLKESSRVPEFYVVLVECLINVGKLPSSDDVGQILELLAHKKTRINTKNDYFFNNPPSSAIVTFLELCLRYNLSKNKILRVLRHYVPERITIGEVNFHNSIIRSNFLKSLAIKKALNLKFQIDESIIAPDKNITETNNQFKDELKKCKEVIDGLFPWFDLRIRVLMDRVNDILEDLNLIAQSSVNTTSSRYQRYNFVPGELVALRYSTIAFYYKATQAEVKFFYDNYIKNASDFNITQVLNFARIVFRCEHLDCLKQAVEEYADEYIRSIVSDYGPEEIASKYVLLAKAVVISSPEDSSVYFDEAIKIVSKFGDEITSRWDAIVSLAKSVAQVSSSQHQTAYRFIRCAEVIGNNLREKYWDRESALRVCLQLSPDVGLASLSRWRDRDIGYFDELLKQALSELLEIGVISADLSWALRKLQSTALTAEEIARHLENAADKKEYQKLILDDAIGILGKQGNLGHYIHDLEGFAHKYGLSLHKDVQQLIDDTKSSFQLSLPSESNRDRTEPIDWDWIFAGTNVTTTDGLQTAYKRFRSAHQTSVYFLMDTFWKQAISKITEKDFQKIIDAYLSSSILYYSEIPSFFKAFSESWLRKVSFKRNWPGIIRRIGELCGIELVTPYTFRSFCKEMILTDEDIIELKKGILDRLQKASELEDAEVFFHFVSMACQLVSNAEAVPLLDYALSRFEFHIEDNFADGPWDEWLEPKGNFEYQIGGFLWSVLGTPWTADRWRASHVVAWLPFTQQGQDVFRSLLEWMKRGKVDQFGSKAYTFYNLHARLYLLIGCSKIAALQTDFLLLHKDYFVSVAFERHALIQRITGQIIQSIETSYPGTFTDEVLAKIGSITVSPFAVQPVSYDYSVDSYWHQKNTKPINSEYLLGFDFPQYWYDPLARVFGISQNQICDLAKVVITQEWQISGQNGYRDDPRRELWDSYSSERPTWHDHGRYPSADSLDFYYSYHAMFVVAADLLKHMPIIQRRDFEEDNWETWLRRHMLTREDGKWISDFRDTVPFKRPPWLGKPKSKGWLTDVFDDDLLHNIIIKEMDERWLYVQGGWHEIDEDMKEFCRVSTALVNKSTSQALLNALSTCKDPMNYKLPYYQDEDGEFELGKFVLKGWLYNNEWEMGIDQMDSEASDLQIPAAYPGEFFQDRFNLFSSDDGKSWSNSSNNQIVIRSENYRSYSYSSARDRNSKDEPIQSGSRIRASFPFLCHISEMMQVDLIIKLHVVREYLYGGKDEKRLDKYKVLLLTSDGTVRDTEKDYKLR